MDLKEHRRDHPTTAGKPCQTTRVIDLGEWDCNRVIARDWESLSEFAIRSYSCHQLKSRLEAIRSLISMTPKNRMRWDAYAAAATFGGAIW